MYKVQGARCLLGARGSGRVVGPRENKGENGRKRENKVDGKRCKVQGVCWAPGAVGG